MGASCYNSCDGNSGLHKVESQVLSVARNNHLIRRQISYLFFATSLSILSQDAPYYLILSSQVFLLIKQKKSRFERISGVTAFHCCSFKLRPVICVVHHKAFLKLKMMLEVISFYSIPSAPYLFIF